MAKLINPLTLMMVTAAIAVSVSHHYPAVAQTCRSGCGSDQIQFTPGQDIIVEVLNRSPYPIWFSQMAYMNPQSLAAYGGFDSFDFGAGTRPNVELYVWGEHGEPLRVTLARPTRHILRVEVTAAPYGPGDRAISVADDGRVFIY